MKNEYEKRVLLVEYEDTEKGLLRIDVLKSYDPQLMLDYTPFSTGNLTHCSGAKHNGISLLYSHSKISQYEELQIVALSEGSMDDQSYIIEDFNNLFTSLVKQEKATHLTPLNNPVEGLHRWIVHYNKKPF